MKLRTPVTVGALSVWAVLVSASPALADRIPDDGEVAGDSMSFGKVLLIYVGLPIAIIAIIWLLASLPYMLKAPRYRPGVSWWAAPVWFRGPGDAEAGEPLTETEGTELVDHGGTGGTSARW